MLRPSTTRPRGPVANGQTANFRALLGGGSDEDRVAVAHMLVGALFLVVGGFMELLALFALRFDELSPISFARFEDAANLNLLIGFGVLSLAGGMYYVLPRITGTRLWSRDLAALGLLAIAGMVAVGTAAIFFGLGSGQGPWGLPWWLDLPLVGALAVPSAVAIGTVLNRQETRSYVSLWFLIGGAVWLPAVATVNLVAHLPFLSEVARAYAEVFVMAGLVTMWLLAVGTGLFYYSVVKELDIPLASRQLASVGFWSLGFGAVWWGTAQLIFGPGPGWVSGVAASLGLALPLAMIANTANVTISLEGHWEELAERPGLVSGVVGLFFGLAVAAMAGLAGFPGIGSVTALTSFWEAIEFGFMVGVAPLLVAGTTMHALPRLSGRAIASPARARSFTQLIVIGAGGVVVSMAVSGILTGFSWVSGANSAAFSPVGEGWSAANGPADTLYLIALGFGLIALTGVLSYASTIFGTVTRGTAVSQEVLVTEDQSAMAGTGPEDE